MRINLKTTPSQMCIPFNYQPKLVGTLHKWLGPNDIHGKLAMHSFSWLMGGSTTTNGIVFDNGARFFISFHDPDRIRQIVRTIQFGGQIHTSDLDDCRIKPVGENGIYLFADVFRIIPELVGLVLLVVDQEKFL